ncbi:Protein of unknown function [Jatrophihabitans endophyticus]|uniref:DUF3592 domain-containing protein n=1 Tax=Jatrophihabitans endophyticus TaxID=1206085 RepID=A0A1M5MAV6_9ACTN|nr:DUF3592 domain-containing protein [Jatrophihabitans endophyticus]SHG74375.1 Protein of unknown function [Jatrophihabitans endophyticus]
MTSLIGAGLLAFPVLVGSILGLVFRSQRRRARAAVTVPAHWATAQGTVVAEESGYVPTGGLGNTVFVRRPIVRYRTADGRDVTFRSDVHASFMPRPGQDVAVRHDPVDPERARIAAQSLPRANDVAAGVVWIVLLVLFAPIAAVCGFVGWYMLTR